MIQGLEVSTGNAIIKSLTLLKTGKKYNIKKIHMNSIDDSGNITELKNSIVSLKIGSETVLEKVSSDIFSGTNTTRLNLEFDGGEAFELKTERRNTSIPALITSLTFIIEEK